MPRDPRPGEAPLRTPKGRHVTAVDLADAEMMLDVIEAGTRARFDDDVRPTMKSTVAHFLADKREEWIACAMVRAERVFRIKRRDGT